MEYPRYLFYNNGDAVCEVVGPISETSRLVDGKAYTADDGRIYIYSNTPIDPFNRSGKAPRFWMTKSGEFEFLQDKSPESEFHIDKTTPVTLDEILEATPEGFSLYDEAELADMNASAGVYVPIINEHDDYLKRLVKEVILAKKVDINSYKSRMDKKYRLTNMKSALDGTTKMTVTVFLMWADLLNFKFNIEVSDAGPSPLPIGGTLKYDSTSNKIVLDNEWNDD